MIEPKWSRNFKNSTKVTRKIIDKNTLEMNLEITTLIKTSKWFFLLIWFFFFCVFNMSYDISIDSHSNFSIWLQYYFCTFMVYPSWRQCCKIFSMLLLVFYIIFFRHFDRWKFQTRFIEWKSVEDYAASWIIIDNNKTLIVV